MAISANERRMFIFLVIVAGIVALASAGFGAYLASSVIY
jgi:hypothetical protein